MLLAGLVAVAVGCGAVQRTAAPGAAHPDGDLAGPPTLASLPELRASDRLQCHKGLVLASEILRRRLPAPPEDRAYDALSVWVENDVAAWIVQRRDGIDETRFLFESGSPPPSAASRAVGSAVVALLQEDTARALAAIPVPRELDNEPEIAAIYRELVRVQSEPFLGAAASEYASCAELAGSKLERFAVYCQGRMQRISGVVRHTDGRPVASTRGAALPRGNRVHLSP